MDHSKSLEIAPFDNSAYKFLLTFYSSYIVIFHCFWDTAWYWSKIANLHLSHQYLNFTRQHSFLSSAAAPVHHECRNLDSLLHIKVRARHSATPSTPLAQSQTATDFKLAILVYKCLHGLKPGCLADELQMAVNSEAHSICDHPLRLSHTCLSTVSVCAFLVAAACTWNSLPQHITSTSSLSVFRARLKTHVFSLSFPILL